ncbi:MarR family winged helix-turn-helix transcriptional regulator [Streptomyces sp. TRM68367]|uniref:MarR family winged helix-turn-helix transcriptional regulator n=1 Tax=Streptomyces sp. TRM68367 TaxID=2758415 RepID=UPI00165AC5D4|nr:MarR family winged helix-turn-helix transcriptional regulator [Streptomyces sp. TRM68367]MBC9729053.1 winged helix-turn-helix transcriptional regulator [Streptomyces sp. TRM68367]
MTGGNDRPAFERGTGFLLARLGSLAARSWAAFLTGHGLTQGQYVVLVTIAEHGPQGQRRLAELVAIDARNIVAVLDSLAARGLIERRDHDTDRRRRIVALTDVGNALIDTIAATAATEQDQFLRALTHPDREHLNHLLRQIYDSHVHIPDSA